MALFDASPTADRSALPAPARSTARAGGAAAAVLALLTACTGSPTSAESEPQRSPAGLEVFYGQKVSFGSCADYGTAPGQKKLYVEPFECVRLTVPLVSLVDSPRHGGSSRRPRRQPHPTARLRT